MLLKMVMPNLLRRTLVGPQWSFVKESFVTPLFSTLMSIQPTRALSNNAALISKVHRESYLRTYPALVVQPDGSSFYIRYHEPRTILQLPLDISTLTPEQLKIRLAKRQPKRKVVVVQEEQDNYQASKYIKLVKEKKK